jgi:uncharacterized protein
MALYLDIAGCEPGAHLIDTEEEASSFGFPPQIIAVDDPVHLSLRITRDGSTIVVTGRAEVDAGRTCDRCLSPFTEELAIDLREVFHLADRPMPAGEDDDDEVHFVDRRVTRLDLAPLIRQRILLELPMKSLCREDCRGLCPTCGVNRNEVRCECAVDPADSRWRALEQLRRDEGRSGLGSTQ